ncbi:hypothetical protein K458DRAFT_471492 [Lentithecium fluviatile CBS 122367]|uniref:Uncharacterized protein n=1 Tax=Lentithecium fluviatile CBS 122367 TaxID=1168545 RepID=A0A6G1J789_9PLEO|nr:hypothetical protein K458DRAFT_471492 [Lentithecium fluviatile CBS 122367]
MVKRKAETKLTPADAKRSKPSEQAVDVTRRVGLPKKHLLNINNLLTSNAKASEEKRQQKRQTIAKAEEARRAQAQLHIDEKTVQTQQTQAQQQINETPKDTRQAHAHNQMHEKEVRHAQAELQTDNNTVRTQQLQAQPSSLQSPKAQQSKAQQQTNETPKDTRQVSPQKQTNGKEARRAQDQADKKTARNQQPKDQPHVIAPVAKPQPSKKRPVPEPAPTDDHPRGAKRLRDTDVDPIRNAKVKKEDAKSLALQAIKARIQQKYTENKTATAETQKSLSTVKSLKGHRKSHNARLTAAAASAAKRNSSTHIPKPINGPKKVKYIQQSDETIPILFSNKTAHSDGTKIPDRVSWDTYIAALEALGRGLTAKAFGITGQGLNLYTDTHLGRSREVIRKGPAHIIDDVDLYMYGNRVHVSTPCGLVTVPDYLTLINVPATQKVRFNGRIPSWYKAVKERAETRKVIQKFQRTQDNEIDLSRHSAAVVYEIHLGNWNSFDQPDPYTDVKRWWALGRLGDDDCVGWFPFDHTAPKTDEEWLVKFRPFSEKGGQPDLAQLLLWKAQVWEKREEVEEKEKKEEEEEEKEQAAAKDPADSVVRATPVPDPEDSLAASKASEVNPNTRGEAVEDLVDWGDSDLD